jgi:hypothetical protein
MSYINLFNVPTTAILQVDLSANTFDLYLYVSSLNFGQDTNYPDWWFFMGLISLV